MDETAGMLEARLALIDRVRRVEHLLARAEQARIASQLMKGFSHELGNQVQIVKLCALELARRATPPGGQVPPNIAELVTDMTTAADQTASVLLQMFAATRPSDRDVIGPVVSHAVRAAVDFARPAVPSSLELRIELADTVQTYATAEELEAMVLAAVLDACAANRMTLLLRERVIQNKRWVELLRFDDRHHMMDGELAHMFEPHSLLHVVAGVARAAGGEASLAPGRAGLELAVELPVAR
jgi:hypothetical protein